MLGEEMQDIEQHHVPKSEGCTGFRGPSFFRYLIIAQCKQFV